MNPKANPIAYTRQAYWHISGFRMYVMQPTVLPFFVNMPEGELIKIDYIDDNGSTVRKDVISLLAKYYQRPKGGNFETMGITDYLAKFTIGAKQTKPPSDKSKKWLDGYGHLVSERTRGDVIPRFQTLLPSAGEVRLFQHVVNMLFVCSTARTPLPGILSADDFKSRCATAIDPRRLCV